MATTVKHGVWALVLIGAAFLAGAALRAGEAPGTIAPASASSGAASPPAGLWVEYRLTLRADPLEALLRRLDPEPGAAEADYGALRFSAPGSAKAAAGTEGLNPPAQLPDSFVDYPVRLTVLASSPSTLEAELLAPGMDEPARLALPRAAVPTFPRAAPADAPRVEPRVETTEGTTPIAIGSADSGAAGDMAAAAADGAAAARGEAVMELVDRSLPVVTETFGAGEAAVEVWRAAEAPFGVARVKTDDLELSLAGFGTGTPPAFPLSKDSKENDQ